MSTSDNSHTSQLWPEDDLEHLGKCPLCGSCQRTVLYEGLRDCFLFGAPGSWTMHRCLGCTCAYLDPRPTQETMSKAYEHYYTHGMENGGATANLCKLIKRSSMNGYLNWKWKTSLSPASQILGFLLLPSMKTLLDGQVMHHLPRADGEMTLLDVGCGDGHFLSLAQSAGWRVTGVDLDPVAVEAARSKGLSIVAGDLGILAQESDRFDAITASHVIEHVYHPQELLNSCYRLLKPEGYFWIETPNIDSYGHSEFRRNWRGLESPRHLQLLSWTVLLSMLNKAGFKKVTEAVWRPEHLAIYCSSKGIENGTVPGRFKPNCLERAKSHFLELINRNDFARREFISFMAWK